MKVNGEIFLKRFSQYKIKETVILISGNELGLIAKIENLIIKELANNVKNIHQSSYITFINLHTDPRSYKVSFKKIFKNLSEYYIPQWDLISGANELIKYFKEIKLNNEDFRSRKYNRIKQIIFLLENNKIDKNLRWK